MNTKNLTVLYKLYGEFADTQKVIAYLLCEDRYGNRHLKYNDDQTKTKYDEHWVYTKYIYPWLNGVDCIPEEDRVNVNDQLNARIVMLNFILKSK